MYYYKSSYLITDFEEGITSSGVTFMRNIFVLFLFAGSIWSQLSLSLDPGVEILTSVRSTPKMCDSRPEDLRFEQLGRNSFRCYDVVDESKSVFCKRARSSTAAELEARGMATFVRYTPDLTPTLLKFDKQAGVLIMDWLPGHMPLSSQLLNGIMDADIGRIVGTAMGRSHVSFTC
jgi:hypothetical protein